MNQEIRKNILLCVAGMTPQIVTETLYALTQINGERVDEVRVITTLAGRDRLLTDLLHPEYGQFFAFCKDYGIDPASIDFNESLIALLRLPDGQHPEDIRSAVDNEHAADQICEIVCELTRDPHMQLHASVAGGRKTMSIYLTVAMQLFARSWDRMSHVLVSRNFETSNDFYYIPPVPREIEVRDRQTGEVNRLSTADAEIHLAEIPFIRLRGILAGWLGENRPSYSEFVQRTQSDLDLMETIHDLKLDLCMRTLCVADREAKLAEREFFIYLLFAWLQKQNAGSGWRAVNEIRRDDLDAIFRLITSAREKELSLAECGSFPRYDFLANLVERIDSGKSLDWDDVRKTFTETRTRINRKLEEAGIPSRFFLTSQGERGSIRYGLAVAPEQITWSR